MYAVIARGITRFNDFNHLRRLDLLYGTKAFDNGSINRSKLGKFEKSMNWIHTTSYIHTVGGKFLNRKF